MVFCPSCNLAMSDGHCAHLNADAIQMNEDLPENTLDLFDAMWNECLSEAPYKER